VKDFCVWGVVVAQTLMGAVYIFQIWRKRADPTISTWIIFLVGCFPSFVTYCLAEDRDIKTGILNTTDLVYVVLVLLAVILWGKRDCKTEEDEKEEKFRRIFEALYLVGAAVIVVYGVITGDMWHSNALTQVLMSFAYLPMWHKMIAQKRNTESYMGWLPIGSGIALFPAFFEGNALSVLYAARSFTLCVITVIMMAYYQFVRPKL